MQEIPSSHCVHTLSIRGFKTKLFVWFMVFTSPSTIFQLYIIHISWWSVLSVKETGVPGEKHRPVASHWQTLSHNVVSSTPCHERVRTHNFSGHRPRLIAQVVVNPTTIRSSRRRLKQKVHCLFLSVVSLLTVF